MPSVLVLSVGSPLGQSISKAIIASRFPTSVHVADINDLAAGLYLPGVSPTILPPVREASYYGALAALVETQQIDAIFPVISAEHEFFEKYSEGGAFLGAKVLSTSPATYRLCNDKYESMTHLRHRGVNAPDSALCVEGDALESFLNRNVYPVFMKPRYGASSQGLFKLESRDQMKAIVSAFPATEFVVQEFLEDSRDFTAGVYTSPDRSIRSTLLIERELKFGLSYRGEIFEDDEISSYCLGVAESFESVFSVNVQFKLRGKVPFAYEINPRLSSTASVRAHFGFNEPEMMVNNALGLKYVSQFSKRTGRFTRYWTEHYIEGS